MVWAQARGGVIGDGRDMPWHLPEDLAFFKEATLGMPVVMGRATWDSLPERFRPLPGRRNIVCTRDAGWSAEGAERAGSVDEALELAGAAVAGSEVTGAVVGDAVVGDAVVAVMGGGQIYAAALSYADECLVTEIDADAPGNVLAPDLGGDKTNGGWERVEVGEWITDPRSHVEGYDGEVRHRHTVWRRRQGLTG